MTQHTTEREMALCLEVANYNDRMARECEDTDAAQRHRKRANNACARYTELSAVLDA